ncbi:UPF0182 family protein [Mycolicibacterium holsaticum]|uniref:UPF0182 family protein n=1 Tax=Mycolicibacterium holsaticum TaxID=152142 RepID=UPI001C7D96A0|nr:UPF0182 family protein [Mycolicibacterium holsaticum]QZA11267.1 UPF0182 family protein [Mycolicibacterium holsaticum DSM 44478 = JCM 12374]UNC11243.1 UPF0182 family protein [Mycolicibacterium holsaticum DSM 44478 = JCM 12374]
MGMRPAAARMPTLTRRSRILIAVGVAVVLLLLIGPRLIDTYVDWLWFGELGYRSVFTTVLFTQIVLFLVVTLLIGAIVFAGLALAYRTRPVFVPTDGPNDPVARYRTAVMTRLKLVGIGVPAIIGLFAGLFALGQWETVQLFLHGGDFGVTDPQFGKDLGFYAFDLPFYRLVLNYLFVAAFLAFIANLLGHYLFGGIRLSGRTGALSRSARIQLISLVGILMLLKALAYWIDRYELLSHTRAAKPFTGAGYTDINAVLPAKLILMAIAVICAAAVFSAIVLRDLRIPAIGVVLLLLSSLIVGAGWPLIVEQFSVKPNAAQKESEYISRSIVATRQAYGLTDEVVTYRNYSGDAQATAQQVAADRATTSNIRLLDPTIVSPAFTQFQQGKNFYYFPDQLSMDRYTGPDGNLRDYVVAARELNPDRLIDNQRDWINRHSVYTHGNGFIASPANTVRGIANDPNQNGGYPEFLVNAVGPDGNINQGPAPLDQPRIYFGPVIANTPADYAIVGENGAPREYDFETSTETRNYTYTGSGGVPVGNWLARSLFAAKFAERNFLFSNVIGENSKILFNRDPADRVEAVAPWLTTDTSVYPAIVNKRMVWIVDGYTTLDNYPYSESTVLSSATADSNEVTFNRLPPDKQVSYIRNSVKATVDAYDGTVTLYAQDEQDPVLQAWMKVFPNTVKPKGDISDELEQHLRYPEDLFKVQRALLAKYHVDDPVTFFSTSDFWDVPLDPNPTASSFQPPYYIVARDLADNDSTASFQLTTAMNRFRRDFLAAYISASSDPDTYGKLTVLTIPGQVNGPKLAFNAISTDTAVSQDLGVIGRDNQNRIRWGNLLTLPLVQGGLLYVAPVYASPGSSDAASSYPRLIRVAMMYNDKVGYGPTVRDALTELFGPGADATATGPAPTLPGGTPPAATPADGEPPTAAPPADQQGRAPQAPAPPAAASPGVPTQLSAAKAAALQEVNTALDALRQAQQSGNFGEFGEALQRLDDAVSKYQTTS